MTRWAAGYTRCRGGGLGGGAPAITAYPAGRSFRRTPFIGLAEAMVVAAFRRAAVSLQHVRRALDVLTGELA
jgi:hypothetical protein